MLKPLASLAKGLIVLKNTQNIIEKGAVQHSTLSDAAAALGR